ERVVERGPFVAGGRGAGGEERAGEDEARRAHGKAMRTRGAVHARPFSNRRARVAMRPCGAGRADHAHPLFGEKCPFFVARRSGLPPCGGPGHGIARDLPGDAGSTVTQVPLQLRVLCYAALPERPAGGGEEVGLDELVEIAVEDRVDVALALPGARVLHEAIGGEDVVADLASE